MKPNNLQVLYRIFLDTDHGTGIAKYDKSKTPHKRVNANQLKSLSDLNMIEVRTINASVWKNGGSYSFRGDRGGQYYEVVVTKTGRDFIRSAVNNDDVV